VEDDIDDAYKKYNATYGLTEDESAAITIYTANSVYPSVNRALRTESLEEIRPWLAYLKLFHTGSIKLSTKKRTFCRGEDTNWIDSYSIGSIVTWVSQ
jgi:hypothetical protein